MTPPPAIVLYYQSNYYTVEYNGIRWQCFAKGLLKKEGAAILAGDRVELDSFDEANQTARIVKILPRRTELSRPKVANVSDALVVMSVHNPDFDALQLDRFIIQVTLAGLTSAVVISKCDLSPGASALLDTLVARYKPLNISVFGTSKHDSDSLKPVENYLQGKTTVLAGLSGVGKSSLINALSPEQNLAVGEVSDKIGRGQHTTRTVSLIHLNDDTYLVDTPGFSYLKFDNLDPQTLESAFPEFAPYRQDCFYPNCLHRDETDCAVKAVMSVDTHPRFGHYLTFLAETDAYVETRHKRSSKAELGTKTLQKKGAESLQIVKLKGKQREASRRTHRQRIDLDIPSEDDKLDPL